MGRDIPVGFVQEFIVINLVPEHKVDFFHDIPVYRPVLRRPVAHFLRVRITGHNFSGRQPLRYLEGHNHDLIILRVGRINPAHQPAGVPVLRIRKSVQIFPVRLVICHVFLVAVQRELSLLAIRPCHIVIV